MFNQKDGFLYNRPIKLSQNSILKANAQNILFQYNSLDLWDKISGKRNKFSYLREKYLDEEPKQQIVPRFNLHPVLLKDDQIFMQKKTPKPPQNKEIVKYFDSLDFTKILPDDI
ncbi:hypothetical protein pb186bvf_018260 [Paramecium bursaria]